MVKMLCDVGRSYKAADQAQQDKHVCKWGGWGLAVKTCLVTEKSSLSFITDVFMFVSRRKIQQNAGVQQIERRYQMRFMTACFLICYSVPSGLLNYN